MEPGRGQKCDVNDLLQFNLLTRKKALGACLGVGTSPSRFQQGEKQGTNQGRERRSATLGVAPLRNNPARAILHNQEWAISAGKEI